MDSKGVLILETLNDAGSASDINKYPGSSYDYLLFRISPKTQLVNDFGSDMVGYPMMPVVDLQTMKVLKTDCWSNSFSAIQACVTSFL